MDASGPGDRGRGELWEHARVSLVNAVRANSKEWFQLDEESEFEDCLTSERVSAREMLDEFSARIDGFTDPPFMLSRITELAHLTHNVSSQYKRHEGFKYLNAVLKATRVRSTMAAFDSFEQELATLKTDLRQGIKLDSITWLEGVNVDEALNDSRMSLEFPEYF